MRESGRLERHTKKPHAYAGREKMSFWKRKLQIYYVKGKKTKKKSFGEREKKDRTGGKDSIVRGFRDNNKKR